MGVVSPNGTGNQDFADAILKGKSGVGKITRFDPSEIPVQIAGEVRGFDELAWVSKQERKHVSRVLPLALAAATEANANGSTRETCLRSCLLTHASSSNPRTSPAICTGISEGSNRVIFPTPLLPFRIASAKS